MSSSRHPDILDPRMFAINHAATALLIRRRYPQISLAALLVASQLMELLWVGFNFAGIEHVTTLPVVRSVADVNLSHMPWSHSLASAATLSIGAAMLTRATGHTRPGVAIGLGVFSHFILDLVTHDHDLALAPMLAGRLGFGLYGAAPMLAFAVELAYGVVCWRVYRGGRALLAAIVGFNVANISFLSASIPGPEVWFANRPMLIVTVVLVQIVATAAVTWRLADRGDGTVRGER